MTKRKSISTNKSNHEVAISHELAGNNNSIVSWLEKQTKDTFKVDGKKNTTEDIGLKQAAIFLYDFTCKNADNVSEGLAEYEVVKLLYLHLDKFKQNYNFYEELKSNAEMCKVWNIINDDSSLQRMLTRRLEVIKNTGMLIPNDTIVKRNLFHREESLYHGWVDTTRGE